MSSNNQSVSLKNDFISSLPDRKKHLVALLFILVLPFILFDDASLGGKRLLGQDTIQWRAGAESIIDYRETHDQEPLWATNMFSGMPAYGISVQNSVPHIDRLIRTATRSIYPVAHYWILLGGGYLLLLLMGMRPLASLIGAICIGFTTYIPIILGAGHNTKFIAYVFIPWMFVGYWLLTRSDKKLLSFALFAIALTLEFRAGHPQITYYFFYLLGFWWLYDTWQAYQRDEIGSWLKTTGLIVLAGILGFAGNAQQYWRFMEYSPFSTRGGSALSEGSGGLAIDYAFRWSQGIMELLTLVIPGIMGGSSGEAYWGPKTLGTSGPHYLGAVAFILALIGLLRAKRKLKFLFFGIGTLTLLFSLGRHLEWFNRLMFNYVPYFDKFRVPETWLIATVFCYSVLSVFGLEYLFNLAKEKTTKLKPLFLPLGIALGFGLIFALGSNALLSFEQQGERQRYAQQVAQRNNVPPSDPQVQQAVTNFMNSKLKPQRKEMAQDDSVRYFIIALLVSGLIVGFIQRKISAGYFLLGLAIIASYDYLSIGDRYTNEASMVSDTVDPERAIQRQQRPLDQFLQKNVDSGNGWSYRVFPLGDNPFNNAVPSYFYPSIGGYSGAKLSYYQDLIDNFILNEQGSLRTPLPIPILDMLNAKYITYPQQLPFEGLTQVYSGEDGYVYENNSVLPKAFFVDSVTTVSSARAAIDAMKPIASFNPSQTAVVEGDPSTSIQSDTTASVQVTHYDARSIELTTDRSSPGYLVLSEIYYPKGWELTIDGESADIYKTNYVLRGMNVPAGQHTLRMEFNPTSYIWGSRVAWASNLLQWGIGLFALVLWYRRKNKNDE